MKIKARIEKGEALVNSDINNDQELDDVLAEKSRWSNYNTELLTRLFSNNSFADEYNGLLQCIPMDPEFSWRVNFFKKVTLSEINRLKSILERLELIPVETSHFEEIENESKLVKTDSRVFVVHGKDDAAKLSVARFLEKLDLDAIILHERPNKGRTIIEKFLEECAKVNYAIIILTPDDIGASIDSREEKKARARQNVIFELGYFIGKLGREKVCALYKENIELPSDYHGVLYIKIDPNEGWKLDLAKEMKEAGLPVDMNKVR
ncbi:MAG: nucleotide-binding protein [Candidatus Krumholzibacteriales bacterium]